MSEHPNAHVLWKCLGCGWELGPLEMPGFAGSRLGGAHRHWQGNGPCGPLVGLLVADPTLAEERLLAGRLRDLYQEADLA